MSLLQHNKNSSKKVSIHAPNQVSRDEIVPKTQSVTFTRNLRVDNHITNQVIALLDLGVAENTKQLISDMVQTRINQLNQEDQNRLQKIIQSLEMKDFYTIQSKSKK
ncbi:hypothetical protein H5W18_10790 [Lactobacillus sp. Marseille-P7033]|nr:hypothetical protein [Lactobacillus sp. Marseille-P7033]NGC78935.1 DUF5388 domain-containing protein [Limosilactobacillus reuteri]